MNAQLKAVSAGALPPLEKSQEEGLLATLSKAMKERRLNIQEDEPEEDDNWEEWD